MAGISLDFRNIVGAKKCAVSSPRIVSLGIGDESPGSASECVFQGIFLSDQVSRNDFKNRSNLTHGCDKQSDKNFLIHSQLSLFPSACNTRSSDKINDDSDSNFDLSDLLNSAHLEQAVESSAENSNSKKTASKDKMKIIPDCELSGGLSDLLSSIAHDISEKDEVNSNLEYFPRKNTQDIEIGKNQYADTLSSKNLSLKVEGNLSDLLSSIHIEDSEVTKIGSSSIMCNSKTEIEEPVPDLSDLLSSIDLEDLNDNKVETCNQNTACNVKAFEEKNELCLDDLLSSIDFDVPNKSVSVKSSKPLAFGNLNLEGNNGISDLLNDFTFDSRSYSSLNNSSASGYSEKDNSKNYSSAKNNITDKVFESDSGYSSIDSENKGFSFFDYSSGNQFSFNPLMTKKSNASIVKHSEDADEEMSMSDLMAIVSPEFKNPVLATLNKAEKSQDSINKDSSSIQHLIDCLNINDSHVINNPVENYDCVDGRIFKNTQSGMEKFYTQDASLGKDVTSIDKSDFTNDDEQNTFIDLRECVKSTEHQFLPTFHIKQHKNVRNQSSECFSPNKILFYREEFSLSDPSQDKSTPFEFNNVIPKKKSRVNTKQTLFSKALACKPKKDISLYQKVSNIKNELLNNFINRPIFIDCDVPQPVVESVVQSDKCILSNMGLRAFGIVTSCELQ